MKSRKIERNNQVRTETKHLSLMKKEGTAKTRKGENKWWNDQDRKKTECRKDYEHERGVFPPDFITKESEYHEKEEEIG